jgi:uncharacterized membrane protein YbhN (UPF0104 family)
VKRVAWPLLQFALGIGLVAALLWGIHRGRSTVEGVLDEGCGVAVGLVYGATKDHGVAVTVQSFSPETRRVTLSCGVPAERAAALCASISVLRSQGEHVIAVRQISARSSGLSAFAAALASGVARWPWLVVSLLAVASTVVFCSWRWLILLRAQGIGIGAVRAGELYLIGAFFSMLLPGAVSGDVVKGWYVTREAPGRRTEAAVTVLLDRVLGLVALVIFAALVLAWLWPRFHAEAGFRAALAGMAAVGVGVCAMVVAAFTRRALPDGRFGRVLTRIREVFRMAFADRRIMFAAILISLVNNVVIIGGEYAAAAAVGVSLRPSEAAAGFLLVNIIAAVPVTPGGLGSREAACMVILGWFGVPGESALAISLLFYAWLLLIALAGAAVWALRRPGDGITLDRAVGE